MSISTIVFDFGGVLIDWNPRIMFQNIFEDKQEMEWFLENVCSNAWNLQMDKGYPFATAILELQKQFPSYAHQISAYYLRWNEMLGGEIPETVKILQEIQAKKFKVYGLTNWSDETFPEALRRYSFLKTLDGIIVSGREKLVKPDPELYKVLISRYKVEPVSSVYIDDNIDNVKIAGELGFIALHFISPDQLRLDLQMLHLL